MYASQSLAARGSFSQWSDERGKKQPMSKKQEQKKKKKQNYGRWRRWKETIWKSTLETETFHFVSAGNSLSIVM